MTITPSDIYEIINANRYGFYQESTFGVVRSEVSYVSLSLLPALPGEYSFGPFYGQSLTELEMLEMEDMPESWSELKDEKKD